MRFPPIPRMHHPIIAKQRARKPGRWSVPEDRIPRTVVCRWKNDPHRGTTGLRAAYRCNSGLHDTATRYETHRLGTPFFPGLSENRPPPINLGPPSRVCLHSRPVKNAICGVAHHPSSLRRTLYVRLIPQGSRSWHLIVVHRPARKVVCRRAGPSTEPMPANRRVRQTRDPGGWKTHGASDGDCGHPSRNPKFGRRS